MERDKKILKASFIGIVLNIILSVLKGINGIITKSTAIVLDAINNLSDALSFVATFIGTKMASKKPDKEHPYGHGRIEYFTTIIVALLILYAGISALTDSFKKVLSPTIPDYNVFSVIIMLFSIISKIIYSIYIRRVGNETKSEVLYDTSFDSLMDVFLTTSTLLGALLQLFFNLNIDGYVGILISLFIIKSSITMLKSPINTIIGTTVDKEIIDNLIDEVTKFNEVKGVYDVLLHNYGINGLIGSIHIELRDDMTAKEIHIMSKEIEKIIYDKLHIMLTIGIYATNENDKLSFKVKNDLLDITKEYSSIIDIHGFYLDTKENTIRFDLTFDFLDDKEINKIKRQIVNELKKKYPNYDYIVVIDRDYSGKEKEAK